MAENNQPAEHTEGIEGNEQPPEERGEIAGFQPHLTHDLIKSEIQRVMRDPWQRILADYVGTAPSLKALQKFADKAPDRWIQGAVMLAQLAGYSKEINVNVGGVVAHVHTLSDADIQQRLNETRAKLGIQSRARVLPLPAAASVSHHNQVSPIERQHSDVQDVPYVDAVNPDKP